MCARLFCVLNALLLVLCVVLAGTREHRVQWNVEGVSQRFVKLLGAAQGNMAVFMLVSMALYRLLSGLPYENITQAPRDLDNYILG